MCLAACRALQPKHPSSPYRSATSSTTACRLPGRLAGLAFRTFQRAFRQRSGLRVPSRRNTHSGITPERSRRVPMFRSIAIGLTLALASAPLYATTYTLEPDYTQGVFRWNHLGFSSPAAQFSQGEATLEFDPTDPSHSSVKVTIPLATLNTGVPALNDDFHSAYFFDTTKFPTATFQSTKVEAGAAAGQLKVMGD